MLCRPWWPTSSRLCLSNRPRRSTHLPFIFQRSMVEVWLIPWDHASARARQERPNTWRYLKTCQLTHLRRRHTRIKMTSLNLTCRVFHLTTKRVQWSWKRERERRLIQFLTSSQAQSEIILFRVNLRRHQLIMARVFKAKD